MRELLSDNLSWKFTRGVSQVIRFGGRLQGAEGRFPVCVEHPHSQNLGRAPRASDPEHDSFSARQTSVRPWSPSSVEVPIQFLGRDSLRCNTPPVCPGPSSVFPLNLCHFSLLATGLEDTLAALNEQRVAGNDHASGFCHFWMEKDRCHYQGCL